MKQNVKPLLAALAFAVLCVGVLAFARTWMAHEVVYSYDYRSQIEDVQKYHQGGDAAVPWRKLDGDPRPNFLFVVSTASVSSVLSGPGANRRAALWVGVANVMATYLALVAFFLLPWPPRPDPGRFLFAGTLAITVLSLAPIHSWDPSGAWSGAYLGYVNPVPHHNPSVTMLQPLALAITFLGFRALQGRSELRVYWLAATAIVCILSVLAKPNHAIAFLPALGLVAAHRAWVSKGALDWPMLFAIGLGSAAPLLWQYQLTFDTSLEERGASILFGLSPWIAMASETKQEIALRAIASYAFPMVAYATFFRYALKDPLLNLAWLAALVGAALTYFVFETGPREGHGNFTWSGSITLFVLFAVSLKFVVVRLRGDGSVSRYAIVPCLVYGMHVSCGIATFLLRMKL